MKVIGKRTGGEHEEESANDTNEATEIESGEFNFETRGGGWAT